ncbi:hypothetical protein MCHIJ_23840 [Mycolicibacterium chitae]|uniref:Secreted protein n=1 Tax=Mycolicibacterium chitae TaxID=1792 RepID=A0A448I0V6_MYCCI|nr:hypothetical protein [Mycolicibacterium chitae]MCV7107647.1 hypothetical protein [Mycolicibacterium chitae]BBZ02947.1 hypothetical protein MCHIJ_23840 [Mycolicibacterium chitae]VEG46002.1 Uncharacterised protein [Mycolicibacterium chitae]
MSSVAVSGLVALTIGLAAPAVAAPALGDQDYPRIQNNTEKVDKHYNQRFGTDVTHPYSDSLIPRPESNPGVLPGQSPGTVPLGPIVGRR